ncbi:PDDEXK nuclease domain-containing protein [Microbacterium sp. NPDC076768]|uniref:PDDEXK nuclease domain-containing protein n=1 Tax=Microbacterium TaxID=33882 RepID=UPI001F38C3EE|nr:PDDEXK nuclease domain-containing protein [Microbacterium profundi]MCE7483545.1 PDDEXK nuclease domain-containing protein [Microbacterium profundi]
MASGEIEHPDGYDRVLADLKARVRAAQRSAQRAVQNEMVGLYWTIGKTILEQQQQSGWGAKIVARLAEDLRTEFPDTSGFNRSNLMYMRALAAAWPSNVPQAVGQLAWGHVRLLLDRLDDPEEREWYAVESTANGWTRAVLEHQIMNQLRPRIGAAPTNFDAQLEPADAAQAQGMVRDPFVFDFLGLSRGIAERDLEQALMDRIVDTLRELGPGFTFAGRQMRFDVDGDEYVLDLLFFHTIQLRYVVVELKIGRFEPEYAGKLGFYVALVDERLRQPAHAPTVGILLCTGKNESVVRYALRGTTQPMAISTYTYDSLPTAEQEALPDADQLTHALGALVELTEPEDATNQPESL